MGHHIVALSPPSKLLFFDLMEIAPLRQRRSRQFFRWCF